MNGLPFKLQWGIPVQSKFINYMSTKVLKIQTELVQNLYSDCILQDGWKINKYVSL